ncbi:MAG: EAL domain-containing protein [Gammaproteobacteria bacterium]|nr:EAL domain-containing protein [Gammaproteobacteria bacterium]
MSDKLYTQTFSSNTRIFSEGDEGAIAYVIESGLVEISTIEKDKQVLLGTLTPGQLFGEMALINDEPRTATAIAIKDTVLTVISREQLTERLKNTEPMLRMLIRVIISRYRTSIGHTRKAGMLSQLNVPLPDDTMSEETQTVAIEKFRRENELREALLNKELLVHYQPLLNMQTGKWAGFEALARWNHPTKGTIPPSKFIPLAEETTLIISIGMYVLRQAIKDMITMQTERNKVLPDAPPLFIAVNVSSKQIADTGFIDKVARVVAETGFPPASLKLEITESMTSDYQLVINWASRCRELGFSIAIDDFGTGYSSMEHLLELEVDTLKVDQTFIKKMYQSSKAKKLVIGMVRLSKALGFSTVAEGLENKKEFNTLRAMSIEYGQGFYIAKPQSSKQIIEKLKKSA